MDGQASLTAAQLMRVDVQQALEVADTQTDRSRATATQG